ncbi:MAG: cyclic nucleotide-binding domain-containing protein [Verrucomicrobia bacterium]|nr:cyclic nucleotide-binding domain-containing protein [Verrucomicrobiota bacterium]
MDKVEKGTGFKILGADDVLYGPVELPTLVDWVRDQRVLPETWVYSEAVDAWHKARQTPELQMFFRSKPGAARGPGASAAKPGASELHVGALRRVKIFAELSEDQLTAMLKFVQVLPVRQWTEICKQGDPGDAMFLILDGEVRVRLMIGGKETILTTLGAGEFFGEISLFDDGPRSADIVANKDGMLLKIKVDDFRGLATEHPNLATPLLLAIGKTLTSRIRADNKRYRDTISFARAAGGPAAS